MITFERVHNNLMHIASSLGEPRIILACFVAAILFLNIIFIIYRRKKRTPQKKSIAQPSITGSSAHVITSQDIRAIAGDDVMSTQLDLARAYLEIGKKQLARKILDHVIKQGNLTQRQEAHQLLKNNS